MLNITKKEMEAVLKLVKSPEVMYNANSLAKELDLSAMGSLKILKRLEKEGVVKARQIGKAAIYRVDDNEYAKKYLNLLFAREILQSSALVRRWANDLRKVKHADMIVLFGSVLKKHDPNDVDVLFVTEQKKYKKLQQEVKKLSEMNVKKIHPMYQSREDIVKNIQKRDKPLLNAIKGVVVAGEEMFLEVYNESRKE